MTLRAAALAVFLALGIAHAQNLAAPSDSYLCNHGDQAAAATKAACARLLGGGAQPLAPPSTAFSAPPPTPSTPTANAAPAAPATDAGEAPDNDMAASSPASADDEDSTHVSIGGSWLRGLGAAALLAVIVAGLASLAVYFLPTIIALARQKRNALAIFVLNAFLGWTFIGWVAALVWSLAAEPAPRN